jgi:hypothetical protein
MRFRVTRQDNERTRILEKGTVPPSLFVSFRRENRWVRRTAAHPPVPYASSLFQKWVVAAPVSTSESGELAWRKYSERAATRWRN